MFKVLLHLPLNAIFSCNIVRTGEASFGLTKKRFVCIFDDIFREFINLKRIDNKMNRFDVFNYVGLIVVLCISQELYAVSEELPESSDELIFAHIVSTIY